MHAPANIPIIEPELLLLAYRSGIFPMADTRDDPDVFWVEPKLRAILPLDGFRLSRSLAKTLRQDRFAVTCNTAFAEVIAGCAAPRRTDEGESWISRRIAASYENLHRLGHAHSIECWQGGKLVGGLYGVGFDRVFCGESMFSRVPDASKIALAWLVAAMRMARLELLDCQFITPHLASLGAVQVTQKHYIALLERAQRPYVALPAGLGDGVGPGVGVGEGAAEGVAPGVPAGFAALLAEAAGAGLASSPGKRIAQLLIQTS